MNLLEGIVVYILIWWAVLFTVLPWGIRQDEGRDPAQGHAPGAPANPMIARRFLVTSAVAAALWAVVFALVRADVVSFHDYARSMMNADIP